MGYKVKRIVTWNNGTELQIYPKWKREPWANTVVYYPLNWDLNDYSWNSRNLTASGTAIYTSWWPWQVASYDGTWEWTYINNALLKWMPAFTYIAWVNPSSITSWTTGWETNWNIVMTIREDANYSAFDKSLTLGETNEATSFIYYNGQKKAIQSWVTTNTRQMLATVFDWSTLKTYVNTTSTSVSCWGSYTGYSNATLVVWAKTNTLGNYIKAYYWLMSNVIVEDKARTADELQKYYNSMKWNYWL